MSTRSKISTHDKFEKAFQFVSSYAIHKDGEYIGKICFSISKSQTSVTAYVHIIGSPMVSGKASGGGYDRKNAAFNDALNQIEPDTNPLLAAIKSEMSNHIHFIDAFKRLGYNTFTVIL